MSADPNWLLSALAQSSAALVAIAGGLIVSRLISLYAERSALLRRRATLRGRLEDTRTEAQSRRAELVADDVAGALEDWSRALFETEGDVSNEDLLQARAPGGWNLEDYQPHLSSLRRVIQEALAAFQALHETPTAELPYSLDDLPSGISVPEIPEEQEIWEFVLKLYREEQHREMRREKNRLEQALGFTLPDVLDRPDLGVALRRLSVDPVFLAADEQRRDRDLREYLACEAEVGHLEQELSVLENALEDVRQPPGIWIGFVVLAGFAVVGIIAPVSLMVGGPAELPLGWRIGLVVAFVAALVCLLGYIGWFIRQLRHHEELLDETAPGREQD